MYFVKIVLVMLGSMAMVSMAFANVDLVQEVVSGDKEDEAEQHCRRVTRK